MLTGAYKVAGNFGYEDKYFEIEEQARAYHWSEMQNCLGISRIFYLSTIQHGLIEYQRISMYCGKVRDAKHIDVRSDPSRLKDDIYNRLGGLTYGLYPAVIQRTINRDPGSDAYSTTHVITRGSDIIKDDYVVYIENFEYTVYKKIKSFRFEKTRPGIASLPPSTAALINPSSNEKTQQLIDTVAKLSRLAPKEEAVLADALRKILTMRSEAETSQ